MSETQKTALERVEDLERTLATVKGNFDNLVETSRYLVDKSLAFEQGLSGIAKTLAGVVKALEKRGSITDKEVLGHIRSIDDDSSRDRIKGLRTNNIIVAAEVIGPMSLVVVTQHVLDTDGTIEQFSGYRVFELPSNAMDEKDRANLVGKKCGDTVEHKGADGRTLLTKIKEIYNAKQSAELPGEPEVESTQASA